MYVWYAYHCIDIILKFSLSTYGAVENTGLVQPVLLLSNPSSFNITVQVKDNQFSARSK